MNPQPSTSTAAAGTSKGAATRDDDGATSTDVVQEAVSTTSGSAPLRLQQHQQFSFTYLRASLEQCRQLFSATCQVKVGRCVVPTPAPAAVKNNDPPSAAINAPADSRTPTVGKAETESVNSNTSSEEDDDVKVFATLTPNSSSAKKRPVPIPTSKNNVTTSTPSSSQRPGNSRTVAKVEDESDSTGSSSSEEDDVKVLPVPPAPRQSSSKQKAATGTKKKGGKGVPQHHRKSSARCKVCGKTVHSKEYLKVHMRKHTGNKRYSCDICRRSFWNSSAFASHKKTRDQHNGVCPREVKRVEEWRPKGSWKCKICGKRMKTRDSYLPHMRSHRGDKRFKCGECGKAFVRSGELSLHKRIHNQVWQYRCLFCERGFHQQCNLFKHLRGHTEEKPYFCVVDGCGMCFRFSDGLKYHRRLIHLKKY